MEKVEQAQKKKRVPHKGNIRLDSSSMKKIEAWTKQLTDAFPMLEISVYQIANEMLCSVDTKLSKADIARLNQKFFNKTKLLDWVSAEIKRAEKEGIEFDPAPHLKILMNDNNSSSVRKNRTKRNSKSAIEEEKVGGSSESASSQLE